MKVLVRLLFWMLRRNGPPPTSKELDAFIRHCYPDAQSGSAIPFEEPPQL